MQRHDDGTANTMIRVLNRMNRLRIMVLRRCPYIRSLDLILRIYAEGLIIFVSAHSWGFSILTKRKLRMMTEGKTHFHIMGPGASCDEQQRLTRPNQRHVMKVAINDAMFLSDTPDVITVEPHEDFFLTQRIDRLERLVKIGGKIWLLRPPLSSARGLTANFTLKASTFLYGKVGSHADNMFDFRRDVALTIKLRKFLPSCVFIDPGFSVWRVTHSLLQFSPDAIHFEGIDLNTNGDSKNLPIEVLKSRSLPPGVAHPTVSGKNAFTGALGLIRSLIEVAARYQASVTRFSCSSQSSALSAFLPVDAEWLTRGNC